MPVHHATDAQTLNAIIQQVWKLEELHLSRCIWKTRSALSNRLSLWTFRINLSWSRFTLTGTTIHENWQISLKRLQDNGHRWHLSLPTLIKSHLNRSLNVKERGFITVFQSYIQISIWALIWNHGKGIKNAPGKLPSWYYMFNGQQFEYLEGSDYKAVVKAVFRLEALQ